MKIYSNKTENIKILAKFKGKLIIIHIFENHQARTHKRSELNWFSSLISFLAVLKWFSHLCAYIKFSFKLLNIHQDSNKILECLFRKRSQLIGAT